MPALLVAGALFMEALDGTIIANALPAMARSFAIAPLDLGIGITAYLVAVGIGIPLSGWAANRIGGRRLFAGAMLLFALASFGCAASPGLASFTAARVVQGLAAAMMTPVGRIIVLRETPRSELVHTMALLTWPALLAPAVAPPLGGLIVEHLSWRWIFLFNLPIGAIGSVLAMRLLPDGEDRAPAAFDLPGWLLWAVASGLLVLLVGREHACRCTGW
ncbi:MFS transporter [Sphingomonas nostoxanthinifaciens]|uniref:MFS transporter n=1 Tax=Sphingomonas nostoxanthinifaciens TaxID=2872652 RepID=UPI001CC1DDCB|nr:MFS transporter [Sphingomonas nostoxanthinifaciens]UAK25650.1 MFS transporter [Sphingomonas nostoxanthinifaciens]